MDFVGGKRDQLVGKIQEGYGMSKEDAQREIENWNPDLPGERFPERKVS